MNKVRLGDVCQFINGGAWTQAEFVDSGYPVLKVSNCKPSGFVVDGVSYISLDVAEKSEINKLLLHDVIIATVGSHPNLVDSAAGRSCVVTSEVEGYYLNQNAVCLRTIDSGVLNQRYLGFLTQYFPFQHYIQNRGKGAANQMRIAISAIRDFVFDLPKISVQNKIANILSSYDDLIENNQKQIKLLEEAAQRIYKEWFVDLRFPGHEDTEIVDGVPEGWRYISIDDVYTIKYGKTLPTNKILKVGRYPVYGASKVIGYYNEKNCENYSVLITSRGNAGVVHRTHHKETFVTNNSFIVNAKLDYLHVAFVFYQMKSLDFESVVTGSCQQQLTNTIISQKKVLLPSQDVLEKFNLQTDSLFNKIEVLLEQNDNLKEARDRLLPKLMSGELIKKRNEK